MGALQKDLHGAANMTFLNMRGSCRRGVFFWFLALFWCECSANAYGYAKAVAAIPGLSSPHEDKSFHPELGVPKFVADAGELLVVREAASDRWFGAGMVIFL